MQKASGYDCIQSKKAIKSKNPVYLMPLSKEDPKYFYQMSFWKEFYDYFWGKARFIPTVNGGGYKCLIFWNLDFGFFPLTLTYDQYFKDLIKSPERALIRKAIKTAILAKRLAMTSIWMRFTR